MIAPELVGGLMLAATGVLTGLTTLLSRRTAHIEADRDRYAEEHVALRRELIAADRKLFEL
ncbi:MULTISPECIES: hypothetical protein [unclassified Pseudonocardia]|uniref:hypothetical protein n=1 Tax=unclassified Pseudonocardia TaxID=2619320 RepID=UPI001CF60F2B|nr:MULTISPECIES: hypothetical protein [unclassified Pseudonocardia]